MRILFLSLLLLGCWPKQATTPKGALPIKLPDGFTITKFAITPGARSLAKGPEGVLFVGTRGRNNINTVYAVTYDPKYPTLGEVKIISDQLNVPNGVAYKNNNLYVGEISRILVYENITKHWGEGVTPKVLPVQFPTDGHHGWKYIKFSPSGELVVPVGAPCNVCIPGKDYAKIFGVDIKSGKKRILAEGVRNTVGFDFHPKTGDLWFTDNGRDMMGEDVPPDELNHLKIIGSHFGYPHCHGKKILDPDFKLPNGCEGFSPPKVELAAHVAPLGMAFYTGDSFPKEYQENIFIAEHGSWNRTIPQGYRITRVRLNGDKADDFTVFASGWLNEDQSRWGRPVDVLVIEDGSIIISDDYAGVLYKISYNKP
jgi:glucose/arabinose dehydrogenase